MRIAQVAPLFESVPPKNYGGTERVVSYLTEELVRQGHDVTLFASGDSNTSAELISPCRQSLRRSKVCADPTPCHLTMLEQLYRESDRFDIIHFHVDYIHFPFSRREQCTQVTTFHGRLDLPELSGLYREYAEMPVVSISDSQRKPIPWMNWQATVYHGLPEDLFTFQESPGRYLAFLGRVSPEKCLDRAVEIARGAGMKLKIAAKIDKSDRNYYEKQIKPLLNEPWVEFLAEIGGRAKDRFLGEALALLFPIDWPEPFGLVMIEAIACGTPVIAWSNGSIPEVMVDGVTGFIVDTIEDAVSAIGKVAGLDRRACRHVFEQRFSAPRMAKDYLAVYRERLRQERISLRSVGQSENKSPVSAAAQR
jgi:glycosyltransferase involved in cell wall biosynthesis